MKLSTSRAIRILSLSALSAVTTGASAQEYFNVNLWVGGRNNNDVSVWVTTDPNTLALIPDETSLDTIQLEGGEAAGIWSQTQWENISLVSPFSSAPILTTINGTASSTATFEVINRRNGSPHIWSTSLRDDSDVLPGNEGNAQLLDAGTSSTAFDGAGGGGAPFGYQISDLEIRDIPFATYDVAVYFRLNADQAFASSGTPGEGNYRINGDIVRPTDPANWKNKVNNPEFDEVLGGTGISNANATTFVMPTTANNFEPDGLLNDISDDSVGNYVIFSGLTNSTFQIQAWGSEFIHLGIAGFQIREAGPAFDPADLDQDGDVDDADFGIAFAAFTGPGGVSNSPADLDNDGDVDDADFGIAFAAFTGPGGGAAVPEPTSLAILAAAGLLATRRRRQA